MGNYKGGVLLEEIARLRRRDLDHPMLSHSLLFPYYLLYAVYLQYMVRFLLVTWLLMFKTRSTVTLYFTYDRLYDFLNMITGYDEYFLLVIFFAAVSTGVIHYNLYCKRHNLLWEMFSPLLSSLSLPNPTSESASYGRFQRLTQKISPLLGNHMSESRRRHQSVGSSHTVQDDQGGTLHFAHLDETHLRTVLRVSRFYQTAYLCYPYGNTVLFVIFSLIHFNSFAFDASLSLFFKVASCVDFLIGSTLIFIFVRILLFHYYIIIIAGYLLYNEFSCITGDFTKWANRWIQSTLESDPNQAAQPPPPRPPARAVFTFLRSEHTRVCLLASYFNQTIVSPFSPLTFRIFITLILFIQTVPSTAIALVLVQLNKAIYGPSDSLVRVLPRMGKLISFDRYSGATWREQNRICDYLQLLLCKRKCLAFSAGVFGTFTQDSVFKFYLIYAAYIMNFTSRFIIDKQETH